MVFSPYLAIQATSHGHILCNKSSSAAETIHRHKLWLHRPRELHASDHVNFTPAQNQGFRMTHNANRSSGQQVEHRDEAKLYRVNLDLVSSSAINNADARSACHRCLLERMSTCSGVCRQNRPANTISNPNCLSSDCECKTQHTCPFTASAEQILKSKD